MVLSHFLVQEFGKSKIINEQLQCTTCRVYRSNEMSCKDENLCCVIDSVSFLP